MKFTLPGGKPMTAAVVAGVADAAVELARGRVPGIDAIYGPTVEPYLPTVDRFVVPLAAVGLHYGGKMLKKPKFTSFGDGMMLYAIPRLVSDVVLKLGAAVSTPTAMAAVSYVPAGITATPVSAFGGSKYVVTG